MTGLVRLLFFSLVSCGFHPSLAAGIPPASSESSIAERSADKIAPYVPRFGRNRPVIAVVGENSSTVLVDFVMPYSILAQSGVAVVLSVATQQGPLNLPPLQIQPDSNIG